MTPEREAEIRGVVEYAKRHNVSDLMARDLLDALDAARAERDMLVGVVQAALDVMHHLTAGNAAHARDLLRDALPPEVRR